MLLNYIIKQRCSELLSAQEIFMYFYHMYVIDINKTTFVHENANNPSHEKSDPIQTQTGSYAPNSRQNEIMAKMLILITLCIA